MKPFISSQNKHWHIILAIFIISLILIYYFFFSYKGRITSTYEIKHNPYTQNMITRCAGRFLIDLPADFTADQREFSYILDGNEIKSQKIANKTSFDLKMTALKKDYEDDSKHLAETYNQKDRPYLKAIYPLQNKQHGMIFDHNYTDGAARILEGNLFSNNIWITLTVKGWDYTQSGFETDKKDFDHPNTLPEKLKETQKLLSRLEGWDNVHIPAEKGSCYPNIFIKGPAGAFHEEGTNRYYFKGNYNYRTISISIDYDTAFKTETTLLQRSGQVSNISLSPALHYKTIRQKVRQLPNMYAEEILDVGKDEKTGITNYIFTLKGNETIGTPQHPYFTLTMQNNSILSEKDALAIWDTIVPTIRPRSKAY